MVFLHFHGNGVGSDTVEVVDYQLTDLVVVLMWDKTGRNLGICLRWDDGLGTISCIAAPDTADIE